MSIPFVTKVRILGEYRDAWLYKRRLYTWDRSGVLRYADLDLVARYLTRKHGAGVGNIIQTLIFRNDWKVGEHFRAMMRVPAMESAFLQPFRESEAIVVDLPQSLFQESHSEPYNGVVLDTNIYADRVYLATTEGLLESYINSNDPARGYELNQQTDFRVSKVAVRYAAINASAEEKGLYFARIRFADGDIPGFRKSSWMKVAETSLTTSHAHHNLLNYTGEAVPALLKARVEESKTHENARYDESQVIGYEGEMDLTSLTYSAASSASKVSAKGRETPDSNDSFEVLGNTNNHLLAVWNGKARVIDLSARQGKEIEAKPSAGYQTSTLEPIRPEDVLQTYPISSGFVVELYDSLRLITRNGSFELTDCQAARVRTFASSLRHKESIAAIHEDHAALIGYYMAEETLF